MALLWTSDARRVRTRTPARPRVSRAADWRDRLSWWALGVLTYALVVGALCLVTLGGEPWR